jgi:hypothetical protein
MAIIRIIASGKMGFLRSGKPKAFEPIKTKMRMPEKQFAEGFALHQRHPSVLYQACLGWPLEMGANPAGAAFSHWPRTLKPKPPALVWIASRLVNPATWRSFDGCICVRIRFRRDALVTIFAILTEHRRSNLS